MALTTNPKVWKVMGVIFIAMTLFFTIAVYFSTLFVVFIVGISLIVITEQILNEFKANAARKRWSARKRKWFGIAIVVFWTTAIIFLFTLSIQGLGAVLREARTANVTIGQAFEEKISPHLPGIVVQQLEVEDNIEAAESYVLSLLSNFVTSVSTFVSIGILVIPLMFYMYFKRKEEIKKKVLDLMPEKFHRGYARASKDIANQLHAFLTAKVVQSAILSTILCVGFYVAGVKGWLLFGVFAGILNIVPYIGPIIGLIPPLLITLLTDTPLALLYVVVVVIVGQIIDNYYLQPFMLAGRVRIDPLVSIILIVIGAQLAGILGMVLSIPVFIVYKVVLKESYYELVRVYGES